MGFGSIIATGISIILLLVSGYIVIAGVNYSVNAAMASTALVQEARQSQADTSLNLSGIVKINDNSFRINASNTGSEAIDNMSAMDVIVRFVDTGSHQSLLGSWLKPCTQDTVQPDADQWYVATVTSGWRDTVDTSVLMPGETATIVCVFNSHAPTPSDAGTVSLSTPEGVTVSRIFNFMAE